MSKRLAKKQATAVSGDVPTTAHEPLRRDRASPVFVARFQDGEITRMSVFHDPARQSFDLARGIALAQAGYSSRTRKKPPPIAEAHFDVADGEVLQTYGNSELQQAS